MASVAEVKKSCFGEIDKVEKREDSAKLRTAKLGCGKHWFKNGPKMVSAARELRDPYIEQINAVPGMLLPPSACGKYDVSRQLEAAPSTLKQTPLLKAA